MNKKKIKKILGESLDKKADNLKLSFDIEQIEIDPPAPVSDKKGFVFPKFIIPTVAAFGSILVGLLIFREFQLIGGVSNGSSTTSTSQQKVDYKPLANKDELYAFSAGTAAKLLEYSSNPSVSGKRKASNVSDDDLKAFNPYLNSLEIQLGDKNESKVEVEEISGGKYQYLMTVTNHYINGANSRYIMEYNQESEEESGEKEVKREGIIKISSDEVYFFESEEEQEVEFDSLEVSVKLTMYLDEQKKDYIIVEQERELGEYEFKYSIYEDEKNISNASLELEVEDDVLEATVKIENTSEIEYDIKVGNEIYLVTANNKTTNTSDNFSVTVEYDDSTDAGKYYTYTLSDNSTRKLPRF